MGIDNIWVFAQTANGEATTGTLELLTKARSLGGSVTAFVVGAVGNSAAALGDHGATKVYETGDLGGALPGEPGGLCEAFFTEGMSEVWVGYDLFHFVGQFNGVFAF